MSIRKREWTTPAGVQKSAWQVDYKDQHGKRRSKQFPRKKDAEAWLTNAAFEVSKGVHTADSQSVTVDQAIVEWLASRKANGVEDQTYSSYETLARLHISPFLGKRRLNQLSKPMVEQFKRDLLANRSRPAAIRALNHLSMIITEAERMGHVAQNAARGVKITKSSRENLEVVIPQPDEVRALIDGAEGVLRPLVMTAAMAALRASELRGLPWESVDLKNATIKIFQRADQKCKIGPPKSAAGYRTIPIAPRLLAALREWKMECQGTQHNLVFPSPRGSIWTYKNLTDRAYHPLQVRLGLVVDALNEDGDPYLDKDGEIAIEAKYGLHCLRHSAASLWIREGIDLIRLKTWMGHAHVQTTIDTYGHLIVDAIADADLIKRAERALFG